MRGSGFRNSLILSTSIIAASLFASAYGRKSHAACVLMTGTYNCEGASAGIAIVANDAAAQTLPVPPNNQFVITEPAVDGLNITGLGALSFTDNYAASITSNGEDALEIMSTGDNGSTSGSATVLSNGTFVGANYGIVARNYGAGSTSVSVTGDVTGNSGDGIFAYNGYDGTSVSVVTGAGAVSGYYNGVGARNYGTGALSITTLGTVTGTTYGDGIDAHNGYYGTSLTVTTGPGAVTGYGAGISSQNSGTGALSITTTGTVTGTRGFGIFAYNGYNGMALSVVTGPGAVTGNRAGIFARNYGDGALSITTTGAVTGTARDGIYAYNEGTSLTVMTGHGAVTGRSTGINAVNYGTGALSITTTGAVTGTYNNGIYAYNDGTSLTVITGPGSVTGDYNGIFARNYGTGALSITTAGAVTGTTADGIFAHNSAAGTSLSVLTGPGAVVGSQDGIDARNYGNAGVNINVTGDVTGNSADGVYAYNSTNDLTASLNIDQAAGTTIFGAVNGINANNNAGSLTITALGTSTGGTGNGIRAYNELNAANLGNLTITANNAYGGANGIYAANYSTSVLSITTTGTVTGTTGDGIYAYNSAGSTSLSVTTGSGAVTGAIDGIEAQNYGTGALSITTTGAVTGTAGDGIYAYNSAAGTLLAITTGSGAVTGAIDGIEAQNYGTGALSITTTGAVTGTTGDGVYAYNSAAGTSLSATTGSDAVTGAIDGIEAQNYGTGALSITTAGAVTGTTGDGIYAYNSAAGTLLAITTGSGVVIGANDGVEAQNYGTGALSITSTGAVTGTTGDGVYAYNSAAGTLLAITTGSGVVIGANDGIEAQNYGTGALSIATAGAVTGTGDDGIFAHNSAAGTSLSVSTGPGAVVGSQDGIDARNYGNAGVNINVTGDVTGNSADGVYAYNSTNDLTASLNIDQAAGTTIFGAVNGINANNNAGSLAIIALGTSTGGSGYGIYAVNYFNAANQGNLRITANNAIGQQDAIAGLNYGSGALNITTTGAVTGTTGDGIFAYNSAVSTSLSVMTGPGTVTGGSDGIEVQNNGTGTTMLRLGGNVTGGAGAGVRMSSVAMTGLTNLGTLSALSGRAISGSTTVDMIGNFGEIAGFVELEGGSDKFDNEAGGTFSARGNSDFGAGADVFNNKAGAIFRLLDSGGADAVTLTGLEVFRNSGRISLQDAEAGGVSAEGDMLTLPGNFDGGGTLAVDAALGGPGSTSDLFIINGAVTGTTQIEVNDTGPADGALNTDGIPVVDVSAGTTDDNDFTLSGGPIDKGLFVFDLELKSSGNWVLASTLGTSALAAPAIISATQNMWHATTHPWLERTADLRGLIMPAGHGLGDPASSSAHSGMWSRLIGQITEQDADNGIEYDESLVGFQLGIDGGMQGVLDPSDTVLFGILGGYTNADIDVEGTSTNADINSYQVGGYLTWLSGGLFADLLVKVDILDVDYAVPAITASDSINGYSLGLSLDTGYRMWLDPTVFFEPMATLSFVHTSIDSATLGGSGINFEDGTSVRGRAGGRLGTTWTVDGSQFEPYVEAFLNGELAGNNMALVNGIPVTDRNDAVYGTAGIGAKFIGTDGMSGFIDLDAIFGGDVIGGSAKLGVRFSL